PRERALPARDVRARPSPSRCRPRGPQLLQLAQRLMLAWPVAPLSRPNDHPLQAFLFGQHVNGSRQVVHKNRPGELGLAQRHGVPYFRLALARLDRGLPRRDFARLRDGCIAGRAKNFGQILQTTRSAVDYLLIFGWRRHSSGSDRSTRLWVKHGSLATTSR